MGESLFGLFGKVLPSAFNNVGASFQSGSRVRTWSGWQGCHACDGGKCCLDKLFPFFVGPPARPRNVPETHRTRVLDQWKFGDKSSERVGRSVEVTAYLWSHKSYGFSRPQKVIVHPVSVGNTRDGPKGTRLRPHCSRRLREVESNLTVIDFQKRFPVAPCHEVSE